MHRRAFVHGLAALPVTILAEPAFATPKPSTQKTVDLPVVVYHFVALGCEDCQRWDQRHLPRWLNSGEFRRTTYRRVEGATVEKALDPRRWPAEARPLAATMRETPAFLVMRQGRPMAAASGDEGWTQVIWPAIRRAAA